MIRSQGCYDHRRDPGLDHSGASGIPAGELITPSDAGYDTHRRVWNLKIDKRPALIARCTCAADVVNAVNFAREERLVIAVRGGAHNVAGLSTCDEGIVLDLSPMKRIDVDPVTRTARAEQV